MAANLLLLAPNVQDYTAQVLSETTKKACAYSMGYNDHDVSRIIAVILVSMPVLS